jgi:pilus assembly protein CpaB
MNKQLTTFLMAGLLATVVLFVYEKLGPSGAVKTTVSLEPVVPKDTLPVVIAKADLEQFTRITAQHVTVKDYPAGLVPQEATANTSEVIGMEVLEAIYKGEFVTLTRLRDPGETLGGLSSKLTVGGRAITISVDAISASGGFIQQGDIVDVIALFPGSSGNEMAKTILTNIKILAIGGDYRERLQKNPGLMIQGGANMRITIAVATEMASKILHLGSRSRYRLILKNPKDTSEATTKGWSYTQLLKEHLPAELNPTVRKIETKYSVAVIKGVSESQVLVNLEAKNDFQE